MRNTCTPLVHPSRLARALGRLCIAFGLLAGTLIAHADDMTPVLSGGVGAAAGAILGESMGGSTGAMVGGALGGAAGAAVATHGRNKNAAIIGGAVGGGAGAVLGHSAGGKEGAAIGAGVGGAAGVAVGKNMAGSANPHETKGRNYPTSYQPGQRKGLKKYHKRHDHRGKDHDND